MKIRLLHSTTKKITAALIAAAFMLSLLPGGFIEAGAEAMESGTCGNSLTWTYTSETLTISGTGEMYDFWVYDASGAAVLRRPWDGLRINWLRINSGVTGISDFAFAAVPVV